MKTHHVLTVVLVTWVVLSFVPSLGLVSLYNRFRGKKS